MTEAATTLANVVPEARLNPTWECKVGVRGSYPLRPGADLPMRRAVEAAFEQIIGVEAEFNFSGWGAALDEPELAIVENRLPSEAHYREWSMREAAPDLLAACQHAAMIFRKYEQMHLAKGTEDGKDKAERNRDAAEAMEAAIAKATPA